MTTVGMILFPRLTQLDLTGPYEVFSRMPNTRVQLVAAQPGPVVSEHGLTLLADTGFADSPTFDVLFVPGGNGVNEQLGNDALLAFLRHQGEQAKFVTAVCTGSLVLGAAGLLQGYRATTHWLSLELLCLVGAQPVAERVVVDRNRITGGGVTAGIDFGLTVAARLHGEVVAKEIQLMMEYDPAPPFRAGSPRTADAATVERVTAARQRVQEERQRILGELRERTKMMR
jgi:cyclohexyl-isocyanide hydratase